VAGCGRGVYGSARRFIIRCKASADCLTPSDISFENRFACPTTRLVVARRWLDNYQKLKQAIEIISKGTPRIGGMARRGVAKVAGLIAACTSLGRRPESRTMSAPSIQSATSAILLTWRSR